MDGKRPQQTETSRGEQAPDSPLMDFTLREWDSSLLNEWKEPLPEFDSSLLEWDGSQLQEWELLPDEWEPLKEWKEQNLCFPPVEWGDLQSNGKPDGTRSNTK